MGGLHYDPVFEFWFPDVLLNATGRLLTALFQPMGSLHYDQVFEFWQLGPLLNAIGLFLTTCFVSANGRPAL
jgi:hypothetical protein